MWINYFYTQIVWINSHFSKKKRIDRTHPVCSKVVALCDCRWRVCITTLTADRICQTSNTKSKHLEKTSRSRSFQWQVVITSQLSGITITRYLRQSSPTARSQRQVEWNTIHSPSFLVHMPQNVSFAERRSQTFESVYCTRCTRPCRRGTAWSPRTKKNMQR